MQVKIPDAARCLVGPLFKQGRKGNSGGGGDTSPAMVAVWGLPGKGRDKIYTDEEQEGFSGREKRKGGGN